MAKVSLGLVGFTDKGDWVSNYSYTNSSGTTVNGYDKNDLVHTESGIYKSLVDGNLASPDGDTEHTSWMVWLDKDDVNSAATNANNAAEKATSAANSATSAATSATSAASAANSAATNANNAVASVQDYLDALQASGNAYCGFARVNGTSDPTPAADNFYGTIQLIRNIGKHLKLCTVKNGQVQHWCAPGRLTLATNGETVAIDGTDGDVMLATDINLYLLKALSTVSGSEMNCMGVGIVPAYWQNNAAKLIKPFAITPGYTVNCKLSDDTRSCAHSIYNTSVAGTYTAPTAIFNETYKASGNGYPSQYISAVGNIQQAQAKNSDSNTNRPYMGLYYEFLEVVYALMYAEMGTLSTANLDRMGVGSTMADVVSAATWNDTTISGNSGVKAITSSGTAYYKGLMSQDEETESGGTRGYDLDALVGDSHYGFREMLETQRICDKITAAGLTGYIGSSTNIFTEDADGNMTVITDGSVDLSTGSGMTANHKYHIVRNVRDVNGDDLEGLQEGVMTAVVNTYVKMTCRDNVYWDDISMKGGVEIYKFSSCVYRGFSIPMDGMFKQLSGFHYTIEANSDRSAYTNTLYCAASVDDVQPLTDATIYGKKGTEFGILKGLTKTLPLGTTSAGYGKTANYGLSLFAMTAFGGGLRTYESCYVWRNYCWGQSNGRPAADYVCVNASAVGCDASISDASARSCNGDFAASFSRDLYAGAFAVPHLELGDSEATTTAETEGEAVA